MFRVSMYRRTDTGFSVSIRMENAASPFGCRMKSGKDVSVFPDSGEVLTENGNHGSGEDVL